MTSRSKRSRKDQPDEAEAPVKETPAKETSAVEEETKPASDEPPVKRGRGRPRVPEHLKKKWESTGRPRGRPRIHPLEPNKPKRPKGRPRIHPVPVKGSSVETPVKRERGRPRKPDYLKTKVSSGRPRGRPRIHPVLKVTNKPKRPRGRPRIHPIDGENGRSKSKKVTSRGQIKRSKPKKEEVK